MHEQYISHSMLYFLVHNSPCTFPCLNGGQCLSENTCNCSIYQATGSRCQTVPNSGLEREMTCRSWGQYNYETFDGLYYYFPGKCSYTLLKDCEDNTQSSVLIQVHNDPECGFRPYSCTRSVSLFLPWEGEIRLQNYNVSFKGQSVQLPHNIHDIELERIADYILVSQAQGFMLAWQGLSSSIYIKMSPEFVGRTCGLCGNFNADIQDDLKTSYGMLTEDIAIFGNSWMEEEPQGPTCPTIPSFYPSPCSTQDPHILMKVEEVCASLLKEPFKSCHQFVSPYSYMASCSNDLCLSGPNGEVVCQVFMEYARVCAHAGHPLHNWRARFPVCIECPLGLHYRECITCCPVHCSVEWMCIDNKLQCLDGCYCPDDLIYDDGMCVKSSDCPCEHRGMLYPSGHTIQDECNNCTCVGGLWNCTKHSCPGECSVTGDMYFQSFDGHVYTFLATCQYVLAKSRNSGGFIVTIQNAPCGPNLDGACIQSVNLILNDDPRTEVTLSHSGEVYMTSQFHITLPHSDEVFQIQELSSMFVQVKTSQGLLLQYNWREFRLYLQLGELWRDDTVGLCGTFNGNIQDDFLAPSGMIESTPHLFGNAWRVSSACVPRPSLPQLDPCDTHQQAASYAVEKCELLMQEVFAVCHEYVSPMVFQLQCRADVCRCGTPCLCSALAHYTRACRKHNVIIEFRLCFAAVTCPPTMEYGVCVSSCQRHCLSLSVPQLCGEECEEGCVCPQGTYYSTLPSFLITETQDTLCMFLLSSDKLCPPGQVYEDCGNRLEGPSTSKGLACLPTCESYLLNLTCSIHEPCVPGCVCPAGLLKHVDECFEPIACPCLWKGKEYYPGDRVSSPCHQCVCQHGSFQCEFRPCASMCTLYGDRHYRTFDGLIFDYIGACKVYLLKTSADVMISVTAKNVDCFENGVICRKSIVISVGQSFIIFDDESGKPNPASMIERQNVYIWNAGYFTFIHLLQYELSLHAYTIHSSETCGKLSGLCGNFDLKTVNDMRTPDNMDLLTAQEFGNSWTAAECVNSPDIRHPCTLNPLREPFAKRQCGILLSEVFQVCHPVVDVTWFYMNCLADTCGCSRGGDCECFCTSVAVYAHRCCHHGITIDWRTPSLCLIGKGPLRLLTHRDRNLLLAANQTNGMVFLKRGMESTDGVLTRFMMTPGLSKTRPHDPSLVSFEAADRPNYFLHTERSGRLRLHKWEDSKAFWDAATFILHRNTWISGFDSLESLVWPGFFLHYMLSRLQLLKYNHSDRYRRATLFKLADYSMGPLCQWRYESCVSPCFRTCSDPAARSCIDILKVEGCVAQCPVHMVLDEVTQKCVYVEDCNAFRTLKSTPVSGTETREYSVAHTTGTTKPTSSAVMKTSTTHLPVKPETSPLTQTTHSLLTITTPEQLETSKTTLPVIPDIDQQATQIISGPSTVSTIKAVETILTTTDQPTLIPRSIHTPWSPAVPVSEKILHTTTSWGLSQTATTRFTSTQSVPPELFQTTIKVAEPTDTSTAVPLLTTHTTVFPSPIEHITSVLTPSQVLPTHVTTPRTSPMVITGTTSKATTASSTESHVSPFPESSSATAHLRESVITSTQLSTSHPTIAAKIMTKETLPSYTPGSPKVTITTSATTLVPQKQPTVSTSMMSTAAATEKPHPTLSTTGSKTSTLSSAILHLKTETTHYPPHTDRAALSTTKATQPSSWSPALYMSSTSPPELTSPSERMTTILTSTISVSTTQGTPRITKTTSISPSLVTEKAATSTFVSLEMTEPVSQTSLFSTIPSTKAYPQTPEHASETKTTAILMSTVTATDSPLAPSNYTTTSSKTTTSPTTSSSSASPVVTERPPAPDISPEVSSVVPATPTSPSVTESKHWMTPEEETSLTKTASSTTTEGVVSPKVCMPPYSEVVDECTKLICVSGQLLLFNKSQSCPYDSSPPNCGLLGFAVQVNGDKCCPKWTCPCRCSVFPDLNVVTFDGNNVAIFKAASYVVTRLPNETISILVIWNFTHLCLTALNITHEANEVLINRIQRHVSTCLYVNSRYAKPRFKKYGFEVLDTGNMYLIRSPAGLKIQWFHSTGMMVIETDTCTNKLSTMGLCGCCDGNPLNDLTLSNGTVVAETEDPAVFIDSWQVPNTTSYVSHSRRREVNCSTSDCSTCHSMLNNPSFTACRPYVPPATFCEVWVRDAEYVNNPCVALAAYVASCNRFNICIEWRSPHYCPFMCPENLQYQACLSACTAVSCPNQDFEYHVEQCSGLSEGCECPQGTLLHRPYSTLCIPPQKCACTDSFGAPRTLGEVWKASIDGCCMYRCESDGIVPVKFNCSNVPQPVCTRAGEISISLADDNSCCPRRMCVCNQSACEAAPLGCKFGEKMVSYFRQDSCCPEYACECDPEQCVLDVPVCREDQALIVTHTEGSCCLAHICMCDVCSDVVPDCASVELLTVDTNSTERCCPVYHCLCEPSRCSVMTCPVGMTVVSTVNPEQCCPSQTFKVLFHCMTLTCYSAAVLKGESLQLDRTFLTDPANQCSCKQYQCVRDAVCIDGERGVMRPGQTLMEHTALGVCYTTRCTRTLDPDTGFYRIQASSTNCTAQCQPRNMSNKHQPGKSWVSDCMRYDCADTQSGPVLVSYSYSCPPFNETECMKIGGTVVTYMDGCCKTCKEDGKSCQKVTVRMTIRKNDCRSNRPVNIVSCDGKCPSASIYNYNINTYARFCKCCREMGLQRRSVQLYCSGNSSWVSYSIQEPTDCSCQWS
uniref:Otogelin n=1 Tax=Electrophorus electricus TaxID=8005 RepID=A0A4W4EJF8_ELEEL